MDIPDAPVNNTAVVCSSSGCRKEFADEEQLTAHKKTHELGLLVNSDCETTTSDQTPTPTRFIRNCEELGLFQDLQNINPFEDTFRRATELVINGQPLSQHTHEDALHTPPMSPDVIYIEEDPDKPDVPKVDKGVQVTNGRTVLEISEKPFTGPEDISIKAVATQKFCGVKRKREENVSTARMIPAPQNSFTGTCAIPENNQRVPTNPTFYGNYDCGGIINWERRKELNRVAQVRSREKRKFAHEQLLEVLDILKKDKKQLTAENRFLKDQVNHFKAIISSHKDCTTSKDPKIKEEVQKIKQPQQCNDNAPKSTTTTNTMPPRYFTVPLEQLIGPGNIPRVPINPKPPSTNICGYPPVKMPNSNPLYFFGPPITVQTPTYGENKNVPGCVCFRQKKRKMRPSKILPKSAKVDGTGLNSARDSNDKNPVPNLNTSNVETNVSTIKSDTNSEMIVVKEPVE